MAANGVRPPHIRCGCGQWFSTIEALWEHQIQPGHVDVGEMFVPVEAES